MATAAQASRASLRRVETDLVSSSQTSMGTLLDGFNSILDIAEDIYTRVHGYIDGHGRRQEEGRKNPPNKGHLWALLIAGSAGFGNYRHQADVAHSYHVLHNGGVPDEHIIVMVYDDIAHNPANPHPGKIINHPKGKDLYAGLPKDYTRNQVNVKNFLAVLKGDAESVQKGPHASGRVIEAGKDDRIFLFYSDHGAPGLLGMPTGEFLFADQLHDAIRHRHETHGFREMVLYIEACESGSMFEGMLEDNINVYATTASNGQESSWGVYCPGMHPSPPPEYMTCLGDLYSVSWMEDADSNDISLESLQEQFERVRKRTSNNYTFVQGSHVMEFGEMEIDQEPVSWYLGDSGYTNHALLQGETEIPHALHEKNMLHGAVEQRDADLMPLIMAARDTKNPSSQSMAQETLERERYVRKNLDSNIEETMRRVVSRIRNTTNAILEHDVVVNHHIAPPQGRALVSDWDCLRNMMYMWESKCGPLGQYGMKHSRAFANICNLGLSHLDIQDVLSC
ncbi:hypothetical protein M9435_006012 [Picochlorum sp. BPE23]|nr:hypothetical protein M9435_006012 [Picochlorum sp. BPE23]